mmetsp:Transcript_13611/g.44792  ORF Transcript_13611/g.44792 Transcript_13611/m.44792 type:complete len:338 (+) Transcript_13611:704-1717(+)
MRPRAHVRHVCQHLLRHHRHDRRHALLHRRRLLTRGVRCEEGAEGAAEARSGVGAFGGDEKIGAVLDAEDEDGGEVSAAGAPRGVDRGPPLHERRYVNFDALAREEHPFRRHRPRPRRRDWLPLRERHERPHRHHLPRVAQLKVPLLTRGVRDETEVERVRVHGALGLRSHLSRVEAAPRLAERRLELLRDERRHRHLERGAYRSMVRHGELGAPVLLENGGVAAPKHAVAPRRRADLLLLHLPALSVSPALAAALARGCAHVERRTQAVLVRRQKLHRAFAKACKGPARCALAIQLVSLEQIEHIVVLELTPDGVKWQIDAVVEIPKEEGDVRVVN